jgi:hypothetical protein
MAAHTRVFLVVTKNKENLKIDGVKLEVLHWAPTHTSGDLVVYLRRQPSQEREEQQGSSCDQRDQIRIRGQGSDQQRHRRANREAGGRRQCSLNRTRTESISDAEFIAGMRA